MRSIILMTVTLGWILAGSRPVLAEDSWPRFRGPTGMGLTTEKNLPVSWGGSNAEQVLWKIPLPVHRMKGKPDHNQSSPIVVGGKVIVTTSYWPEGRPDNEYPEHHITCNKLTDGEMLWDTQLAPGPWKLSDLRGGYTAPTPVSDGKQVFVLFGSAVLAGLDLDGHVQWRVELADYQSFDVAIAVSPIIYQDQLLLIGDRSNRKSTLTAYSLTAGKVLWESKRPEVGFAHSTPVIAEIGGRTQMLVAASNALQGLDPRTGRILWSYKTAGDVCSPVADRNLVNIDSGRGGSGVAIEAPAPPPGESPVEIPVERIQWKIPLIPEGLASPVIFGNQLFRSQNQGVLRSFDLTDGHELYATRLEGMSSAASPIVTADGLIYFASAGKSYVVRAGKKYELVSTNDLDDPCAASPAVGTGKLILKGQQYLFCIGRKK
jgi:outer membrane protein assembly factor BamB